MFIMSERRAMNDPHVDYLLYNVCHGPSADYSDAKPLAHKLPDFDLTVDKGKATFTPTRHFATVGEARAALKPIIEAWELDVFLREGPDKFRLEYERAQITDRNPTPDTHTIMLEGVEAKSAAGTFLVRIGYLSYPTPPSSVAVKIDGDIEIMRDRYLWYRNSKEPITTTAYFCVTMIESAHRGAPRPKARSKTRERAAEAYSIDYDVIDTAAELSSARGGDTARKAEGIAAPLTSNERNWLDAAIKVMIRRFAEYKADPSKTYPQITMANLPKL